MEFSLPRPAYRAYPTFDELPEGCMAFLIADLDTLSIVRPGECVVVDTTDRLLEEGELFVLTHARATGLHARVVQMLTMPLRGFGDARAWWAAPYERRRYAVADGPYDEDGLSQRIVGRVVGIYAGGASLALSRQPQGPEVTPGALRPRTQPVLFSSFAGAPV